MRGRTLRAARAAAAIVALAAAGGHPAMTCALHACSNDPLGILGDEVMAWDASAGTVSYYEVCDDANRCRTTTATELRVSGTDLSGLLRVRACDQHVATEPPACSAWSPGVEFLPHACTRHVRTVPRGADDYTTESCEYRCFDGAPRRLPNLPECQP